MKCRTDLEIVTYYLIVPLGILFNLIAYYIIQQKSKSGLNSYKIVMQTTCIMDLIISLFIFFFDLHSREVDNTVVFAFFGSAKYFLAFMPCITLQWCYILFFSCQIVITNLIVPPFVYRYLLICRNYKLSRNGVFLLYLASISFIIPYVLLTVWMGSLYGDNNKIEMPLLIEQCSHGQYIVNIRVDLVEDKFHVFVLNFLRISPAINLLSYPIVLMCGLKIVRFMHNNSDKIKSPKIQNEVTKTLVLQALLPFLITGVPSLIGQTLRVLTNYTLVDYQIYALTLRECIPLLNPCFTIYFVRVYRQRFLELFF